MLCLLVQPIHPDGIAVLEAAGIRTRMASAADMGTVAAEIVEADAVITRNAGLSGAAMRAGGRLQVVGNHGTGLDPVDLVTARDLGIPVVYTPEANVQSVAEHVIAQIMAVAKRIREADAATRENRFDYRYTRDFVELSGKTLLILGFGAIGRRTAEIAKAGFGMRILVHSPSADQGAIAAAGFEAAPDLDAALARADVVSLHQRLNDRTRGMFGAERFAVMKPGAILVNTARGALVQTAPLLEAIASGRLRGAATDVFDVEPPPADHPLLGAEGVVLSPHIAGATEEALVRTAVQTAEQVVDVIAGRRPPFLVDAGVWDRRRVQA
ncbi:hydroxyacid dehydrogenase [Roseicyclus sp.]|uniref:hydroxyacid dehydrogenase n=1 Tax=Roseicyclus sp. TaxID=1914329 RepID=UPI003F9F4D45